jgi:hypothetical protein
VKEELIFEILLHPLGVISLVGQSGGMLLDMVGSSHDQHGHTDELSARPSTSRFISSSPPPPPISSPNHPHPPSILGDIPYRQFYENYISQSCEGLALPFLVNWLAGDITNLVGCVLTDQKEFQVSGETVILVCLWWIPVGVGGDEGGAWGLGFLSGVDRGVMGWADQGFVFVFSFPFLLLYFLCTYALDLDDLAAAETSITLRPRYRHDLDTSIR